MKAFLFFYFFVTMLLSLFSCAPAKNTLQYPFRLSAQEAKEDIAVLHSILEKNHPSLYWYTTKDSLDGFFEGVLLSINDSLTELQLKNKIAWLVNKIHCGHTAVRSSQHYARYYASKRLAQFPLSLKVWDDSIVVLNNFVRQNPELKRGTVITGINGYSNRKLLDSIFQFISTDGFAINFKQQVVSFNFPYYYSNAFGSDSQYRVTYVDSSGRTRNTVVKTASSGNTSRREADSLRAITRKEFRKLKITSQRSLAIDTGTHTAILKINTFSEGKLKDFFRRSFKKMRADGINNLVIDLRENGGGNIMNSTRLTRYIIDHPFKIADTVAALSSRFAHKRYIKPWFVYWLSMQITGRKKADGRVHFNYFEKHFFKPKSTAHYYGKTYIVSGGYSFSAATLFTGALKGQHNVTVLGEETGGGYYGNTAMHLPVIYLPNSKTRVMLPLYRIVIDSKRLKTGRGIFPDIEVKPSSAAIKRGADVKMETVFKLINADRTAISNGN